MKTSSTNEVLMNTTHRTTKKVVKRQPKSELAQAEIQILSHILNVTLNQFEAYREDLKNAVAQAWDASVPGETNGQAAFEALGQLKDQQREFTAKYKRLAGIQRKLKQIQRR